MTGDGATPDYSKLGHADGKPYLLQNGPGRKLRYHLRYATVDARSENAAKKIQKDFRRS